MTYTERDDKHDETLSEEERALRKEESKPKHKAPFMPDPDDDSPFGSTDQHSDA